MSTLIPVGYNEQLIYKFLEAKDEKGLKEYIRGYFTRKLKLSIPEFLKKNGEQITICAFCGRLVSPEFILGKDVNGCLAFIKVYPGKYPFMCSNKDCSARKLNPNSVERVSKSLGVSEETALQIIHNRNKSPFYRENYSSLEAYKQGQTRGSEFFKDRYGENAITHQKEMGAKISYKNSKNRYVAEGRLDDYNRISAQKAITIENLRRLYSEDEAQRVHDDWKEKIKNTKKNLIKKYGTELGEAKYKSLSIKRSKNLSLEGFIERFGEEAGLNLYQERCKKASVTLDVFLKKYGESGREKYAEFLRKIGPENFGSHGVSKESWRFFAPIVRCCFKQGLGKSEIKIGTSKRKEFWLSKKDYGFFFYDFCIPKLRIIVEYNGEGFHPNPAWPKEKWDSWRQVFSGKSADEVHAKYLQKVNLCKEYGFTVIQVFSSESVDIRQKEVCDLIIHKLEDV